MTFVVADVDGEKHVSLAPHSYDAYTCQHTEKYEMIDKAPTVQGNHDDELVRRL